MFFKSEYKCELIKQHLNDRNADKKNEIYIVILSIEDRDEFDHFVFDSKEYSPFHLDPRVVVSSSNRFIIS